MKDIIDRICSLVPHVIFLGHRTDKTVHKKGLEVNVKEISLTGKLKSIISAEMDAIGYLYREEDKTMISFIADETSIVGGRCPHLSNQEIEIASMIDDKLVADWSKIYLEGEK